MECSWTSYKCVKEGAEIQLAILTNATGESFACLSLSAYRLLMPWNWIADLKLLKCAKRTFKEFNIEVDD